MKAWFIRIVSKFMATCRETSDACTDLAEGALSDAERARVRRHLRLCPGCRAYRAQMEAGLKALHELPPQELAETEKDDLMRRFRERQERRVR
jgi:anti-sigma factor RsiW